jgi:hypothetical protein
MTTTWELVIMVTKTSIAQEFFFITAVFEFWKFDRLVAKQGDGCLVAAPKTIQRQANLHRKGMYNNKTKLSLNFSSSKLQQILTQKPINQLTNKIHHQFSSPHKNNLTQFCCKITKIEYQI